MNNPLPEEILNLLHTKSEMPTFASVEKDQSELTSFLNTIALTGLEAYERVVIAEKEGLDLVTCHILPYMESKNK